ncbi:MAG: rhodanese-like domain-containing protein, partial [Candidatus Kapaibacterium sp.]
MVIERFYLACLSHASYMVSSDGEAVVIDPQRDVQIYRDYLEQHALRLKYVIETHLHADFVSGHLELAGGTGAEIVMGRHADAAFQHRAVQDGDLLSVGTISLRVLETPGHTPEGITIAASDAATPDEPVSLFTGDTLFAGDVGRPDLLGAVGITKEELAGRLYDSLHEKILTFPDETRVYPAHGAGSSCGKALRSVEFSTIGAERMTNYALKPMSREEFIVTITDGQPEAPAYFLADAAINRQGAPELASVITHARAFTAGELADAVNNGAILLDTRDADTFSSGYIPGSINIGLDGQFATWVGTLLPIGTPLVIVAEPGRAEESVLRCARVGYDSVAGYLAGGITTWVDDGRPVESFRRLDVAGLQDELTSDHPPLVLDVRRDGERAIKSIPGTEYITLSQLPARVGELKDVNRPMVVHCAGGYRSAIAISILRKSGIADVADLLGGIGAWEKAGGAM